MSLILGMIQFSAGLLLSVDRSELLIFYINCAGYDFLSLISVSEQLLLLLLLLLLLHNVEQESASAAKYLGVTITDDLSWSSHIDNTTMKAKQTLGFLKRNIRVHSQDLKSVTYKTLVRPQLEYTSTVSLRKHAHAIYNNISRL